MIHGAVWVFNVFVAVDVRSAPPGRRIVKLWAAKFASVLRPVILRGSIGQLSFARGTCKLDSLTLQRHHLLYLLAFGRLLPFIHSNK